MWDSRLFVVCLFALGPISPFVIGGVAVIVGAVTGLTGVAIRLASKRKKDHDVQELLYNNNYKTLGEIKSMVTSTINKMKNTGKSLISKQSIVQLDINFEQNVKDYFDLAQKDLIEITKLCENYNQRLVLLYRNI